MKKIFNVILCLILLITVKVNAASFGMSLSSSTTKVKVGEEVNISININNVVGIPNGLNVCQAKLTSSGVTIKKVVGNDWNVTNGNMLILDSAESVTSSKTIATINAVVNSAGSVSLSNIMCTDGDTEYNTSNRSISFSIKEETTTKPTTTTTTTTKKVTTTKAPTTTRPTTTKKTTTTTKTTQKNNTTTTQKTTTKPNETLSNTLLKNLIIEGYTIEFNKNIFEYRIEVENNVENLIINAEPEDNKSTVQIIGNESLIVGENKIQITVTNKAESSTYNLTVYKKGEVEILNTEESILNALKIQNLIKVKVDINDSKIITTNILNELKQSKKTIIYEVYQNNQIIYSFKLNGNNVENTNQFSYNIKFSSNYNNSISEQLKNNEYKIINFDYRGSLPKDTEIVLYNLNIDGKKLYLYDYNENKDEIEYIHEIEKDNNIVLKVDKTSEYIVSNYRNSQIQTAVITLFTVLALLCLSVISIIIYKTIKNKKVYKY